jgi:hypothetical protein
MDKPLPDEKGPSETRLYVGGLPEGVTTAELTQRFAPFGAVGDAQLIAPRGTALPREPLAYVTLTATPASLARCLKTVRALSLLSPEHGTAGTMRPVQCVGEVTACLGRTSYPTGGLSLSAERGGGWLGFEPPGCTHSRGHCVRVYTRWVRVHASRPRPFHRA